MPDESISGDPRRERFARLCLVIAVVFFVIGVWVIFFPVYNINFRYSDPTRMAFDALALIFGGFMMALGFTVWRIGVG